MDALGDSFERIQPLPRERLAQRPRVQPRRERVAYLADTST